MLKVVSADQKCRLTIEQLGTFAQPVTQWSNHQELKLMATAVLQSAQRPKRLYSELSSTLPHLFLYNL